MPKLWEATIEGHKDSVKLAIVQATAKLVHGHGVTALTMSAIANTAGIGRATLYRYVKDTAEAIQLWHAYQIGEHLRQLQEVAAATPEAQRLSAVLERYATNRQHQHGNHDYDALHRSATVSNARQTVATLLKELISADSETGAIRTDSPIDELVQYAIASLEAAAYMPDRDAALRLARIVEQSLRPSAADVEIWRHNHDSDI